MANDKVPYSNPVQFDQKAASAALTDLQTAIAQLQQYLPIDQGLAAKAQDGWAGRYADDFNNGRTGWPFMTNEGHRLIQAMGALHGAIQAAVTNAVTVQKQHDLANTQAQQNSGGDKKGGN